MRLKRVRGGTWDGLVTRHNRCAGTTPVMIDRQGGIHVGFRVVFPLGTTMPGTPVAHFATVTIPATATTPSVFVVVFPHSS